MTILISRTISVWMMFRNENTVLFPDSAPPPQISCCRYLLADESDKAGGMADLPDFWKSQTNLAFFRVRNDNEIILSQIKIATIFTQILMLNHIFRHPHKYFKAVSIYK